MTLAEDQIIAAEAEWLERIPDLPKLEENRHGMGRELFGLMRAHAGSAEEGASALFVDG